MALEPELATFRRELPGLLADERNHGLFALVHGDAVSGLFPTAKAAIAAGYDRFGLKPFMVKVVAAYEKPLFIPWFTVLGPVPPIRLHKPSEARCAPADA